MLLSGSVFLLLRSSKRGKGGGGGDNKKKERKRKKMCFRKRARNTIARTKKRLSKRTFSRRSRYPNSHFDSYPISRLVNPRRVAVASRTFSLFLLEGDEKILVRRKVNRNFSFPVRAPSLSAQSEGCEWKRARELKSERFLEREFEENSFVFYLLLLPRSARCVRARYGFFSAG